MHKRAKRGIAAVVMSVFLLQGLISPMAAAKESFKPVASGMFLAENQDAVIDYSNTKDGYVMVKYCGKSGNRLKAQVKGPKTTYTYNITRGKWEVFPLSDGNGAYTVSVFENVYDTKYATVVSQNFSVKLKDEFAPFLRPNQYVNYEKAPKTLKQAEKLVKNKKKTLDKVTAVYNWVVKNISYDKKLAQTVQSGYLPELDKVLKKKKGICFDYAALMAAMLRSQGIPCKLVVGYAGTTYHAWIDVWTKERGWVDKVIFFNGKKWQRMDPTFASGRNKSDSIMKYIGDGKNYTVKYLY